MRKLPDIFLVLLLVLTVVLAAAFALQQLDVLSGAGPSATATATTAPSLEPTPEPTLEPTLEPTPEPLTAQEALAQAAGKKIPVLQYYSVAASPASGATERYIKPSEFEKQLEFLQQNGYQAITFEDLVDIAQFEKPILLTFDESSMDNYRELVPILRAYNAKATIFVETDKFTDANCMDEAQVKELADSGVISIQGRTKSGARLSEVTDETELTAELAESKTLLEAASGKPVLAMAYPGGEFNDTVKTTVALYYDFAVDAAGGVFTCGEDCLAMKRVPIRRSTTLDAFGELVGVATP